MGAGVAAIVTKFLTEEQSDLFTDIRCLAVSPPPVMDLQSCKLLDNVISVVQEDDSVSQLGIYGMKCAQNRSQLSNYEIPTGQLGVELQDDFLFVPGHILFYRPQVNKFYDAD